MFITKKTKLKIKLNSILMLCLLVITAALLARLTYKNSVEYDWTVSGRHTLSDASLKILSKMPEKIEVISYARETPFLRQSIKKFIGKYQRHKPNLVLSFVNPDTAPDEARNLGITVDGEIIVRYKGRTEHLKTDSEQVFANTLKRLIRNQERWIAFVEGHGERSALSASNDDLGGWVNNLVKEGYRAQPINLLESKVIPDNTKILVIASPTSDYLPNEIDIILDYIDNGGNLLWLHEPGSLYKLNKLAEKLSIEFLDGVIIDTVGREIGVEDPTITFITKSLYQTHPITENFDFVTLFPMAGAIKSITSEIWLTRPILNTGKHTWSETGKLKGEVELNLDTELQGPLTLGLSLEREYEKDENDQSVRKKQRIIVVGDGDFLSNTYFANNGNGELGSRMINWLNNDDDFILIPSKTIVDAQLKTPFIILGVLGAGFLFLVPLIFIAIGIMIQIRRKKQ